MSGNTFGRIFRITTFGESHGKALGVVIDGVPANLHLDIARIQEEMDRRRPGGTSLGTRRNETDQIEIVSGLFEGRTTGCPLTLLIYNRDQISRDYGDLKDKFRPGHADYTYEKKYGIRDYRGGGRSSGRETAARVAAGAVARQILEKRGIEVSAGIRKIGKIEVEGEFKPPFRPPLFTISGEKDEELLKLIEEVRSEGDSLGGIVECHIKGLPAGIGDPCFDKLDALLSHAMLSIGAVKAIEFGSGFSAAEKRGSENNDQMDASGFLTNHAGGILGGISTGEEIIMRLAFKPTPSIYMPQMTQDRNGQATSIEIKGRHDPIVLVRALPVVEAMGALCILDSMMIHEAEKAFADRNGEDY